MLKKNAKKKTPATDQSFSVERVFLVDAHSFCVGAKKKHHLVVVFPACFKNKPRGFHVLFRRCLLHPGGFPQLNPLAPAGSWSLLDKTRRFMPRRSDSRTFFGGQKMKVENVLGFCVFCVVVVVVCFFVESVGLEFLDVFFFFKFRFYLFLFLNI